MSGGPLIPKTAFVSLLQALRLLRPILSVGEGDRRALSALTCRARPEVVRNRITARSAVYVAWDARIACCYVGSVHRAGTTAVADRLTEHYRHPREGRARVQSWALLTVLPLRADATVGQARGAEGWAARILSPLDGQAHPGVDIGVDPAALWDDAA